ncbi:MAG: TIGR01777 family oxidoreductase [Planctomycetota bacterium]
MKVVIAGSTGLVGTALVAKLQEAGHDVIRLVRRPAKGPGEIQWDPANSKLDAGALDGVDGVVHLGGDNIAEGRWTDAKKKRIRESRVMSTTLLAETLASMENKPKFFVCASAIGYYGRRGDEVLTESSAPGTGFLPEVCQAWEASTKAASDAGVRVVNVRIGVVLARNGGALAKMLTPFKLGLGGVVGSGRQYWSAVPLTELVNIIKFCCDNEGISGPVNAVTPNAENNKVFTKTLGRVLGRPTIFPLPGFVAKILLGEMADDLLLGSTRVEPAKLKESGYEFIYSDLESALRAELG